MDRTHILLAGRDESGNKDIKKLLASLGYTRIRTALCQSGLMEEVNRLEPDMILIDARKGDGIDWIETIDTIHSRQYIPIVSLSVSEKGTLTEGQLQSSIEKVLNRQKTPVIKQIEKQEYKDLVEMANAIIIKFDNKGKILFLNQFGLDFYGYTPKEIIGKYLLGTLIPKVDSQEVFLNHLFQSLLQKPDDFISNVNENIRRNGERVWINWTNKGIYNTRGELTEILSTGQDISSRIRLEQQLKKEKDKLHCSREQFRGVFENTSEGIFLCRISDWKISMANSTMCNLIGYKAAELQNRCIFDFYPRSAEDLINENFNNNSPIEIAHKNGDIFEFEIKTTPVTIEKELLLICLIRDVTELQKSKRMWAKLHQAVKLGRWEYNHQTGELNWTDGLTEIFEFNGDPRQERFNVFIDTIHPEDRKRVLDRFKNNIRESYTLYHRLKMKDGRIKQIKRSCHMESDPSGNPLRTIGFDQDITELHEARQKVVRNESRLKFAQEIACLGSFEIYLGDGTFFWSDQVFRMLGYIPGEFEPTTEHFKYHIHNDDRDAVRNTIRDVSETLERREIEFRYFTKSRDLCWVKCTVLPELNEQGSLLYLFGTLQEITEMKTYQEGMEWKLRANSFVSQTVEQLLSIDYSQESLTASLLESMTAIMESQKGFIATVTSSPDYTVQKTGAFSGMGMKRNEYNRNVLKRVNLKCPVIENKPKENCYGNFIIYPFAFKEDEYYIFAFFNRKDGYSEREQELIERISRVFALAVQKISTQSSLKYTKERFQDLIENSLELFWEINTEGELTYISPRSADFTGRTPEELIGTSFFDYIDKRERESVRKVFNRLLASRDSISRHVHTDIHKKGNPVIIETSAVPILDSSGELTGFRGVKRNITEDRKHEKFREDMERIIRHDLKSPLNSIIGYPQILMESGEFKGRNREYLGKISSAGNRMLEIINRYLDISRLESGEYMFEPVLFNVAETMQNIREEMSLTAEKKNIDLSFMMGKIPLESFHKLEIKGEEVLCYTALSNLIKNAIEASPESSVVHINTADKRTEILIEVCNQGTVPEEIRNHFFDKYVSHGKTSGRGLGTYSAKLMIETIGGSIDMHTSEETGTVVSVCLPRDPG